MEIKEMQVRSNVLRAKYDSLLEVKNAADKVAELLEEQLSEYLGEMQDLDREIQEMLPKRCLTCLNNHPPPTGRYFCAEKGATRKYSLMTLPVRSTRSYHFKLS